MDSYTRRISNFPMKLMLWVRGYFYVRLILFDRERGPMIIFCDFCMGSCWIQKFLLNGSSNRDFNGFGGWNRPLCHPLRSRRVGGKWGSVDKSSIWSLWILIILCIIARRIDFFWIPPFGSIPCFQWIFLSLDLSLF